MKKYVVFACGLALATLSSTPMFADTLFNFSFTGNNSAYGLPGTPFSGSGQFDARTTNTAGEFRVIGVTGTTDGMAITGLVPRGVYQSNDNLLFYTNGASSASVDYNGISYRLADGFDANIFLNNLDSPPQDQELIFLSGENAPITITPASLSAVPEPSTLALLGTGALGLFGTLRRKLAA